MPSNGQTVIFAAPRRPWRWAIAVLFGVSSILLAVLVVASPDSKTVFWLTTAVWLVSLFGTLIACLSRFIQIRQGASGPVAWIDSVGIHIKGDQAISWPDVESVFTRRASTGEMLLCVRPREAAHFVARAPSERRDGMQSNLDKYQAPLFINLTAFWRGTIDDLSAKIGTFTSGRLSLNSGS